MDKVCLKLKWKHQFQFAGYYAALEKGFYRDSGLDVTIIEQQYNENSTEAILKGQCQFGIAGSDLILKRSEGEPVIALAAIYQHSPMVFLTKESSGIENIHQITGRRIMLEEHSAELLAYLKSENLSISQLKTVPHTYGVEELIDDKVDVISAYSNDEPFNLKGKNINYRMFSPQSSGIDFYGDILFTVEEQVKQHPARVKKFLEASLKGWQYALQHPEEISNLILNKYSKRHSLEHLLFEAEGARKLILPDVVPIGFMTKGRWEHILEKYRSLWLIKDPVKIDEFIYQDKPQETNYVLIGFQIIEVMLALLAIWFVVRFIRIYSSHESLDQINREIQQKLRRNQKRFSLLLTNLPGMAYRCKFDENWTMLFISKGCFELTGYYPEELLKNRKLSYSDLIVPEDRKSVEEAVKSSFHRGDSFKINYRIKCKDGQVKWVWEQGRFNSTATSFKKLRIEGF
ncbi:MAG: ABC transporter substrate-binding protein, partial [Candidatus Riflebacteria bacterium]